MSQSNDLPFNKGNISHFVRVADAAHGYGYSYGTGAMVDRACDEFFKLTGTGRDLTGNAFGKMKYGKSRRAKQ
jgi:hypothetical protein